MTMSNEFMYTRRNPTVQAVWWNGDNRDEVTRFFRDCGMPESEGPYFSRDEYPEDDYNTVEFYAGDDFHIDEKRWITWDGEDYGDSGPRGFSSIFDADLMS